MAALYFQLLADKMLECMQKVEVPIRSAYTLISLGSKHQPDFLLL